MPGLQEHQPPSPVCRNCGRPADGQCAWCHCFLCSDCSVLTKGLSRPLAVCESCSKKPKRPAAGLVGWLLIPAIILLIVMSGIMLLRNCG